LGSAEVIHPFHPLRGQRFVVLKVRIVSGVETLSLRHADLGSFALPREWTDWGAPGVQGRDCCLTPSVWLDSPNSSLLSVPAISGLTDESPSDCLLHDCSGCFRRERIAGWVSHPLESAAFHGAHPERSFASARSNAG